MIIWALDQDNSTFGAYNALIRNTSLEEMDGSSVDVADIVRQLLAYTGQNCYVTMRCTDGSPDN